ncbi:uncharacterized protein LOC131174685 [Hevea brasiliensis]|uniref:uncharacterized protein LOC131174685 n=1 Tax=Hevea brasiliensis TaxID=3981 RepID=UPI0025D7FE43|nr:uncharacterized protein LOC131174685 [Hevea brasiliensis]
MEATKLFSSPMLSRRPFLPLQQTKNTKEESHSPRRKIHGELAVVIKAKREGLNGGDYWGHTVDENMIVLRMRIKDMKLLEGRHHDDHQDPCSDWEKKYYVHYNADVCEAMGLLQN